ncbi:uncharacterized protein [Aquarana catesbeiana]|uniref:uncharacterized protein n=1 Tax=Aquarana catesbeiana TaxID=8400 RepID=UPI003CC9CE19
MACETAGGLPRGGAILPQGRGSASQHRDRQSGGPASRFSEGPGRVGQRNACVRDRSPSDDIISPYEGNGGRNPQMDVAPPPVAQAAGRKSARRTAVEEQQLIQRDSSSSSEEGELSDDPQEAAVESGPTAGGSSHLRQPESPVPAVQDIVDFLSRNNRVLQEAMSKAQADSKRAFDQKRRGELDLQFGDQAVSDLTHKKAREK